MTSAPIDTAPAGDGWILGFVGDDDRPQAKRFPWMVLTRCDGGWSDGEGYDWMPTLWAPLPDPQPEPTGWRPAEGEVLVEVGWLGETRKPIWLVSVVTPDGKYDDTREPIIADTSREAVERADAWAAQLGLCSRRGLMDHPASVVVPFKRPETAS